MSKDIDHNNNQDRNFVTNFMDVSTTSTSQRTSREGKRSPISNAQKRANMEQVWVMTFNGTMISPNCDFRASVNSTAIRIDWEATAGKAMNYSFYMMTISSFVCPLNGVINRGNSRCSLIKSVWNGPIFKIPKIAIAHLHPIAPIHRSHEFTPTNNLSEKTLQGIQGNLLGLCSVKGSVQNLLGSEKSEVEHRR